MAIKTEVRLCSSCGTIIIILDSMLLSSIFSLALGPWQYQYSIFESIITHLALEAPTITDIRDTSMLYTQESQTAGIPPERPAWYFPLTSVRKANSAALWDSSHVTTSLPRANPLQTLRIRLSLRQLEQSLSAGHLSIVVWNCSWQ